MPLPTFLIIGANKAGTTSLHNYLDQHPDVHMSPIKEPMFFIFEGKATPEDRPDLITRQAAIVNRLDDYMELFRNAENKTARGESSTTYLHNSQIAAGRIKAHIPQVKIIAILRNPIERAHSNYRMYLDFGLENRSFATCVDAELQAEDVNSIPQGQQYLHLGLYAKHVRTFLDAFSPSQTRFFLYEEWLQNPRGVIREILKLIGVDPTFVPNMEKKYLVSGRHRELSHFPAATRRRLVDFYREDVAELGRLLEVDLERWLDLPDQHGDPA